MRARRPSCGCPYQYAYVRISFPVFLHSIAGGTSQMLICVPREYGKSSSDSPASSLRGKVPTHVAQSDAQGRRFTAPPCR